MEYGYRDELSKVAAKNEPDHVVTRNTRVLGDRYINIRQENTYSKFYLSHVLKKPRFCFDQAGGFFLLGVVIKFYQASKAYIFILTLGFEIIGSYK